MKEPYTAPCIRSVEYALSLLKTAQCPSADDIRHRRRAALIARQAAFDELRRRFITPLDREDLWQLRRCCERIAEAAENAQLLARDTALLSAECTLLLSALTALPLYPKDERVLQHLTDAEKQLLSMPPEPLSSACAATIEVMRLIVLKAT